MNSGQQQEAIKHEIDISNWLVDQRIIHWDGRPPLESWEVPWYTAYWLRC